MRISDVVEAISEDLAALAGLGDDATAEAARRLSLAMRAPMTARVFDILTQVAAELETVLPGQRVEVRIVGGDTQLSVTEARQAPLQEEDAGGDDAAARVTLRLPAQLKARVEEASAREGLSVNTYIVRVLNQQVRTDGGFRVGRRLHGYGRS